MSKLFCEICGTAYSDSADQCPICGCPKPESVDYDTVSDDYAEYDSGAASVKGGRFSKSNVNKRMKYAGASGKKAVQKKANKAERGLIIAIIVLILAILSIVGYLLINYFLPASHQEDSSQISASTTPSTTPVTYPTILPTTEPDERPCTGLSISEDNIRFNTIGATWLLNAVPTPANTTDTMTYLSSNTDVATVKEDGTVTSTGEGECVITVVCGDIALECKVTCNPAPQGNTPGETQPVETQPGETTPEETQPVETKPADTGDFKLNREDFTLKVGESWKLYDGSIDPSKITWTSTDSSVATVINGRVKGVGKGQCWIVAEYNGVKLKCIVYVTG